MSNRTLACTGPIVYDLPSQKGWDKVSMERIILLQKQILSFKSRPHFKLLSHPRKQIQSTLVISTSVISNNRLSRRENLVRVLSQKSKIRLQNIVEKT